MTEPQSPMELSYESAAPEPAGRRPAWVWAVVVVYLLLASVIVLFPAWVKFSEPSDIGFQMWTTGIALALAFSGLGLVFTRVRIARRRPLTRASLWIPLIASGFLIGILVLGAGWALTEYLKFDERFTYASVFAGAIVWMLWAVVIFLATGSADPTSVASKLHYAVFGGSVVELLVAVSCHIVVRKRGECCAGIFTGTAICVGCVVMLISLGPGVAFLYYRRWKQIRN